MTRSIKIGGIVLFACFCGWFVPPVFLLGFGTVQYLAYEPDGTGRYTRVVGPRAGQTAEPAQWTPEEEINTACRGALIAAEDLRFYSHFGVDFKTISSAVRRNWRQKKMVWGGSSITQQLVKNVFLDRDKSVFRKSREILGALVLDRVMSKNSQIVWYLNVAEFGPRVYGISNAAGRYFNQSARDLSLAQCVALFAILPEPIASYQSLVGGEIPNRVLARRRGILRALELSKRLPLNEVRQAAADLKVQPLKAAQS